MPGILPMKVIKVGANAQARIAQACDRCRSKKIRCDGIRPCCSQCANVGFECKTSDKLSRRAFPRGYTESLEERVRCLETEVRELKELLDEKDEKIDMLSRIHSQTLQTIQLPSPRRPSTTSLESNTAKASTPPKDDLFKVQQSPCLLEDDNSGSYFAGTSSSRSFVEAFKHRVQESGRSIAELDTGILLAGSVRRNMETGMSTPKSNVVFRAPPRLVSDQYINVFFQEWAPLFPVLHRPTFLSLYERYIEDHDGVTDKAELAQLNLVFGIAALSSGTRASADLESFEEQWKAAVDLIINENTMATLQVLILAQLFCVQQGDLTRLQTYKALSTSLSARLGLHQSQKRFALGTLTCETRKKVFWTLYTLDAFTAVTLGLPKHLKDDDIECEIPCDADDEYVTERGFQPTLPGESTKLSSALALFRAAKILSKVLEEVYPAKTSYELSLKKLSELSDELDLWSSALPPHLRLQFAQDKPSTGTISSRSPLLSLTYHYIRALIHRPAVCASIGARSSTSMMCMASSSKHMIQLIQLLDERGMSFSFCLNRDELLILCGVGLLFQGLGLEPNSKILRDNGKMVTAVVHLLQKTKSPCANDFERVANSFITTTPPSKARIPALSRHNSDGGSSVQLQQLQQLPSSTKKQLKAIASRLTASAGKDITAEAPDSRRSTVPHINLHPYSSQTQSTPQLQAVQSNMYDPSSTSRSEPARSPVNMYSCPTSTNSRPSAPPPRIEPRPKQPTARKLPNLNLDYLSFGNEPEHVPSTNTTASKPIKPEPRPTDWEKLLGSLDNGDTNIYDACYGGQPVEALMDVPSLGMTHHGYNNSATAVGHVHADSIAWNADLFALYQTDTHTSSSSGMTPGAAVVNSAGSVLSFSSSLDEALSLSEEDFAADWASAVSSTGSVGGGGGNSGDATSVAETFRGLVVPADESGFEGWEVGLNL